MGFLSTANVITGIFTVNLRRHFVGSVTIENICETQPHIFLFSLVIAFQVVSKKTFL